MERFGEESAINHSYHKLDAAETSIPLPLPPCFLFLFMPLSFIIVSPFLFHKTCPCLLYCLLQHDNSPWSSSYLTITGVGDHQPFPPFTDTQEPSWWRLYLILPNKTSLQLMPAFPGAARLSGIATSPATPKSSGGPSISRTSFCHWPLATSHVTWIERGGGCRYRDTARGFAKARIAKGLTTTARKCIPGVYQRCH